MKFENTNVSNFSGAFRGMRNPLASWEKADSLFGIANCDDLEEYDIAFNWIESRYPGLDIDSPEFTDLEDICSAWLRDNGILQTDGDGIYEYAFIGPNDMSLAMRLCKAGPEHRKFLRQIQVCVDITAPLYWYKEFDTYKVGTTANSTSTMHKLASTPITINCFEINDFDGDLEVNKADQSEITDAEEEIDFILHWHMDMFTDYLMEHLEDLRIAYNETKDKRYWKELVRWLPNGWLQTRTVTLNYEVIRTICHQRARHKLVEWNAFIEWAHTLPYAEQLIFDHEVAF